MSSPKTAWRPDRNQLITVGMAAGMLACFIGLVYVPRTRAARAATQTFKERQSELADKTARTQHLPELTDKVNAMHKEYARDLARIPSEPRVAEFLRQVADILVAEEIDKREVVPEGQRLAKGFTEMPVRIAFDAPFASACRVLARLEALDRIGRVESLKLSAPPDWKSTVHVEMRIVVFHSTAAGDGALQKADSGKAAQL